jgi:hypothetical protein
MNKNSETLVTPVKTSGTLVVTSVSAVFMLTLRRRNWKVRAGTVRQKTHDAGK